LTQEAAFSGAGNVPFFQQRMEGVQEIQVDFS
jgi:hypothetical protein